MTYRKTKAIWKGVTTALVVFATAEIMNLINTGTLPLSIEEWKERGPALGVAFALGALKVAHNTLKHRGADGNPIPAATLPQPPVLAALLVAGMLGGCATMLPSVGGRTINEVRLDATAEGGYTYTNKKVTPGGVEATSLDKMTASINADGDWEISVAGDRATDTGGQAAMVQNVAAVQAQNLAAILNLMQQVAGPFLDARVREGEIKADVAKEGMDKIDAAITAGQFDAFLERWIEGR